MKIRTMGNSLAVNGRSDIAIMYVKSLTILVGCEWGFSDYDEEYLDGWNKPPFALDRENIKWWMNEISKENFKLMHSLFVERTWNLSNLQSYISVNVYEGE